MTWTIETKIQPASKITKTARKNCSIRKNLDGSITACRCINKETNRATDWTTWPLSAKSWCDMLNARHYVVSANPNNILDI